MNLTQALQQTVYHKLFCGHCLFTQIWNCPPKSLSLLNCRVYSMFFELGSILNHLAPSPLNQTSSNFTSSGKLHSIQIYCCKSVDVIVLILRLWSATQSNKERTDFNLSQQELCSATAGSAAVRCQYEFNLGCLQGLTLDHSGQLAFHIANKWKV